MNDLNQLLSEIAFARPALLWGLWAAPIVAIISLWPALRRTAALNRFASQALVPNITSTRTTTQRVSSVLKSLLLALAFALGVLAIAGPRWGTIEQTRTVLARDIAFVLDVSRSMLAEDLAPNRLERAKLWTKDAISAAPGDRIAIVAFAGSTTVAAPLTLDHHYAKLAVDELSTASAGRGGTNLGDAIRTTIDTVFEGATEVGSRDIVLITDGEDLAQSFPVSAAQQAGELGIRIIAIGIGSPDTGSTIRIQDDEGQLRTLTHNNQIVRTTLDSATLRDVALATPGGQYFDVATGTIRLENVYRQLLERAGRQQRDAELAVQPREQFQWFLIPAISLLFFASTMTERTR